MTRPTDEDLLEWLENGTKGVWQWRQGLTSPSDQWTLSPGILIAETTNGTPDGDSIDQANAALLENAPTLAREVLERREAERRGDRMVRDASRMHKSYQEREAALRADRNRALSALATAPEPQGEDHIGDVNEMIGADPSDEDVERVAEAAQAALHWLNLNHDREPIPDSVKTLREILCEALQGYAAIKAMGR